MFLNVRRPQADIVHTARNICHAPEVIIKVMSPGSSSLKAIRWHFEDLQNGTHRALEMDFLNTPVVGKEAARGNRLVKTPLLQHERGVGFLRGISAVSGLQIASKLQ